jgi:hypothetical protein
MRISPSQIRKAITDPNYRVAHEKPGPKINADGTLRKAIRMFHTGGVEAASAALDGLKSEYWRGAGLSRTKNARHMLDTYIDLARADRRTVSIVGKCDVRALDHVINADVDVVLRDSRTVAGRICIFADVGSGLSLDQCALVAAAPFRGLCDEFEPQDALFGETVTGIDIWQLRSGKCVNVLREEARDAWPALLMHLARATEEP